MRITLDVNILVRAIISPDGPARRLLDLILYSPLHTLVLSEEMLSELRRVLLYPRLQARRRLDDKTISQYVGILEEMAEIVEPELGMPIVLRDPDDDIVLYTAVAGKADVLCTLNSQDFSQANVIAFCEERGIRLMTDVKLLWLLSGRPDTA
jgi:putative PIN family toxin of toxin-antitoxin system